MDKAVLISVIFAVLSPFVWALMNVADKYVVSNKTKKPLSFTLFSGFVCLIIGVVLALFLDWSSVRSYKDILVPAIAGVIFGTQYFIYFYAISKEDISDITGLTFFYPVVVAMLSFFILSERFSLITYFAISLVIIGAVMISFNVKSLRKMHFSWMIILMILGVAIYEFLFKISTTQIPELNGIAITQIFIGLSIIMGVFHTKTRKGVLNEFRNLKWVLLTEGLTFLAVITTFYAMSNLSATIVATLSATQPLIVLLLEKWFHLMGINISKDGSFLPKLIPISLIVIGIILLYAYH